MKCGTAGVEAAASAGSSPASDEIRIASRTGADGLHWVELSVPGVHCANCIRTIETGLMAVPGVRHARVNLSSKRVSIGWQGEQAPALLETLAALGFPAHPVDTVADEKDPELGRLIRALAVAGFAAMNIMLLSVSVWSGADAETRQVFHWISAVLAFACLAYSGRVFFASAWRALRNGRTNMDVPISIGVSLAYALSLHDTIHHGRHAYFDATTSLIFFLLIGRTLDHLMRERTRSAVRGLMRLSPRGATVRRDDGSTEYLPVSDIQPGMRILVSAGDRIPIDGTVEVGNSDLDCAIATGESTPRSVQAGSDVQAGTLNLTGALTVRATARVENSFLAEMVRLMEAAEGGRARYRRLADRAARLYAPVVHATAFLTFLGWMATSGDWQRAIGVAVTVLIITCPCALGLAVPIVQVMAARRLFENGIMVKDGSGIERLAEIDMAVFDKTGTLTSGNERLLDAASHDARSLAIAAALGSHSNHPRSRALAAFASDHESPGRLTDIRETAGCGIEGRLDGRIYRLGRADWALTQPSKSSPTGTVLACDGRAVAVFQFEEQLREGAADAVQSLATEGIGVEILSGDSEAAVKRAAQTLGIDRWTAGLLPGDKVARLAVLAGKGRKVLMVGDGLNDAPAMAAAHVSMAPVTAADIGRNAADFVFLRNDLAAVPLAHAIAKRAGTLVRQNFGLAIAYNVLALPIAISGHVTPLIAALAMSGSSLVVIANALRLRAPNRKPVSGGATGAAIGTTNATWDSAPWKPAQ